MRVEDAESPTVKIPEIARIRLQASCRGITVAKVREAEVMASAGIDDILIHYPGIRGEEARAVGGALGIAGFS